MSEYRRSSALFTFALSACLGAAPGAHAAPAAAMKPWSPPAGPDPVRAPARMDPGTAATWTELAPPARGAHVGVYDARRHRLIVFGGSPDRVQARADVWALDLAGTPRWERLEPEGPGPAARVGAAAVYDERRDRMLLFGGEGPDSATGWKRWFDDVWELSFAPRPRWRQLHPSGEFMWAYSYHTATLDPANDRVIVIGDGFGGVDAWSLSLGGEPKWTALHPQGPAPIARRSACATYASALGGILYFGGDCTWCPDVVGSHLSDLTDTWFLSTTGAPEWVQLTPRLHGTPPSGTEGAVAVYDEASRRMIVVGGLATWWACWPVPCGDRSLMGDAWTLSMRDSTWRHLSPDGVPPERREHAVGFLDSSAARITIHGGEPADGSAGMAMADTWALDVGEAPAWFALLPGAAQPGGDRPLYPVRYTAYDHQRHRLLSFDGSHLWSHSLTDGSKWEPLFPQGEQPPARGGHVLLYDDRRDELVLIGGASAPAAAVPSYLRDVWSLSLHGRLEWRRRSTGGTMPNVMLGCGVVDPGRDRIVLYSGTGGWSTADLWELPLGDGGTWRPLPGQPAPWTSRPTPRQDATAVLDTRRDRFVLFGGSVRDVDGTFEFNDTWAFTLGSSGGWTRINDLSFENDLPARRRQHAAVYDPAGDRMIVFGGVAGSIMSYGYRGGVWALDLGSSTWSPLAAVGGPWPLWATPVVAFEERSGTVDVFEDGMHWRLDLGAATAQAPGGRKGLGGVGLDASAAIAANDGVLHVSASPDAAGGFTCAFSLPRAADASLSLFDVLGRCRGRADLGRLDAGAHAANVVPAGALPSGVYFVRLQAGPLACVTKAVRLE